MQRFYFEALEEKDDSITIKNPLVLNQMIKVLRVREGEEFVFFNGVLDIDFIFKVISVDKREIYLEKVGYKEVDSEIDYDINIISALPNKIEKLEYVLQKGTEIGVSNFLFFKSDRSQKINLSDNKLERLEKIIIEAAEQSGRSRIPEFAVVEDLDLSDFSGAENVFFHTKDDNSISLKNLSLELDKDINIFTGPEGGFSDEEISAFEKSGFKRVHLGNRILRTETTPVVTSFYIIQNNI